MIFLINFFTLLFVGFILLVMVTLLFHNPTEGIIVLVVLMPAALMLVASIFNL